MAKISGYIYVVKIDKYYKIGKTLNPSQRFGEYTLFFENPETILLEYVKYYSKIEKELHKKFENKRVRGEWFKLLQEDLDFISELLKNNKTEFSNEELPKEDIFVLDDNNSPRIKLKGKFIKTMCNEKKVVDMLIKYPSTYLALNIMKRYIVPNYNILLKNEKKYKCVDLARDMGITRQSASSHISKLKELNVLNEINTDRGKLFCINPKYYFRGEEVPKSVLDVFNKEKQK